MQLTARGEQDDLIPKYLAPAPLKSKACLSRNTERAISRWRGTGLPEMSSKLRVREHRVLRDGLNQTAVEWSA